MKKQLQLRMFFTLFLGVMVASLMAQGGHNVMFIGNGSDTPTPTGEDPRDSLTIVKIQEYGYTVTFISDNQTKSDPVDPAVAEALEACDLILVSSTVGSGDVLHDTTILQSGKPIMTWEYGLWDDMYLCVETGNFPWQDTLVTLMDDIDLDLVGDLTGAVQAVKSSVDVEWFIAILDSVAPGAVVAATAAQGDSTLDIYLYLEEGETMLNDEPADKRMVAWGLMLNESAPNMTDLGWELFLRAMVWTANDLYTGISPMPFDNKIKSWFANNSLYLDITGLAREVDIKIFDITGKMIKNTPVYGDGQASISMDGFANGVYIFVGDSFAGKFVKQ